MEELTVFIYDDWNDRVQTRSPSDERELVDRIAADGYKIKFDDHQGKCWAYVKFETVSEAVAFKLKYL